MAPLVSVIIPAYNAAPWIDEAVQSVLTQTLRDLELVVVDDGSSDQTCERVLAIAANDARVRLLRQSNAGPSVARNLGLRSTTGSYIQYLDADDVLAPKKIASQVERLDALPPNTLATGPYAYFTTDPWAPPQSAERLGVDLAPVDWVVTVWTGGGGMPTQAFLIPRSLSDAAGPWLGRLRKGPEDAEYFTRLVLHSAGVAFCPQAASSVRWVENSRSKDLSDEALTAELQALELMAGHLLRAEDSPRTRAAAAAIFDRFAYLRYPRVRPLVQRALERSAALGGSAEPPGQGRAFLLTARAIGWRPARWLAYHGRRLGLLKTM